MGAIPDLKKVRMTPTLSHAETSLLRVACQEWNPHGSRTVVLLHGWPDSIRTWSADGVNHPDTNLGEEVFLVAGMSDIC